MQGWVAHLIHEQVLKLLSHLRRQAVEQVLHARRLLLHLGDQLLQRLRRVRAEEIAVLLHELLEVRFAARHLLGEHLVQVLHHLLHPRHIFRRHIGDLLGDVLEEGLHHRLLQHLHQLLEFMLSLRIHELVVLQLLDLAWRVLGQPFEELLLALRDAVQQLGELRLVVARWLPLGRLGAFGRRLAALALLRLA